MPAPTRSRGGEIERALAAGVPPSRIVFAGIAKTDDEIRFALRQGIMQLNVESVPELMRISAVAQALGLTAPVALRINPDVDAGTLSKISTGRKEDKFGIPFADAPALYGMAASLPGIDPVGCNLHNARRSPSHDPFASAYRRVIGLLPGDPRRRITSPGSDLGGWLRRCANATMSRYGPRPSRRCPDLVAGLDAELSRPGRALRRCGVLVASVIYRKESGGLRFPILYAV